MSYTTVTWNYPSPTISTPSLASTSRSSTSTAPSESPISNPDLALLQQTTPSITATATIIPASTTTTPSTGKRKRPSMPVSTTELRQEDDWTRVKDPKEKKRIQNRVAQRTYRHRMKARLGELQARLERHERRRLQQSPPDSTDSVTSNGMGPAAYANTACVGSPLLNEKMPGGPPMQMMPPHMYEQSPEAPENPIFVQHQRHLSSPPQSTASPQPNGLLSPPGQPGSDPSKPPQEPAFDCLRFQSQLLNRLNNLHDPSFSGPFPPADHMSPMLDGMTQAEQVQCMNAFTPPPGEGMEFAFDGTVDVWKTEAIPQKMRSSPSSADTLSFPPMPAGVTPPASMARPMMDPTVIRPTSQPMPKPLSLDERFEGIMEHVQAAGFDSFDSLVTAYYSDTFNESSPLAYEQRLSRNRRLPKVIEDVFQATNQWSSWERRGFQEEILKTAETMLISERASAQASLVGKIVSVLEAHDTTNPAGTVEALMNLKRCIQDELPNSWALSMALAADTRNSWQRDRSNTALATTVLLSFSGRIPNDQLLQILGACL